MNSWTRTVPVGELYEISLRRGSVTTIWKTDSSRLKSRNTFSQTSDGLPELGPILESTKFTSNPSVPAEEQHASACLQTSVFSSLEGLEELPCPKTNIWNQITDTGTLGGYSSEADVNTFVKMVIIDVLEALGLRGKVTIRAEVEVMRNRPDFMLILVNGSPIGTIQGKQPGKDALEHPNILGEVYDQLMHLHSIFRVNTPFAILTCYQKWRICWLNKNDSSTLAAMDNLPLSILYQTPVERKQELVNTSENMNLGEKLPSPQPPPTSSRKRGIGIMQDVGSADSDLVDEKFDMEDELIRQFCGTPVIEWNDRMLPVLLASVIKKMMFARQDAEPTVVRLTSETTSAWKKAPPQASLNFDRCISGAAKYFYFWEDLGHGADGRAFLVSGGTRGAVGVLKFFFQDPESKAQYEEKMWKAVYSHLLPVANTLRVVNVMGQAALLMPWFQCPGRTQLELDAVHKTLLEDFQNRGLRHDDIAWRNVGVYHDGKGRLQAVVFDMQKVRHVVNQEEDWVQPAIASLSQELIH